MNRIFKDSFTLSSEDIIPVGSEKIYNLPPKRKGESVFLEVIGRRDSSQLGGYGHYMQLKVNNNFLDAFKNRKEKRLINKPHSFIRTSSGREVFWNLGDGMWLVFFAPDFKVALNSPYGDYGEEGYRYLLDITDLIEEDKTNQVSVTNLLTNIHQLNAKKEIPIIVSLNVKISDEKREDELETIEEPPVLKGPFKVSLLNDGAFQVTFNGNSLLFESDFSYPNGGFNSLGRRIDKSAEDAWVITSKALSDTEWEISAKGKFYSINRRIKKNLYKIDISDTITNLTSEDLGIIFSNHLSFEKLPVYTCRMGGKPGQSLNNMRSPSNPTLFLPFKDSSLGIVANDNVYRNHGLIFYDMESKRTGIKDEIFAIRGNASYTLSWSIYITPSEDYYDFINVVRRDWGSNITLDGPVYFTNYRSIAEMSDNALEETLTTLDVKYLVFWEVRTEDIVQGFGKPATACGVGIFDPVFEEEIHTLKNAIEKLRRVKPELKVSLYTHCFFMSPEKPMDPTYKDSWITDAQGNRGVSQYDSSNSVAYQPVYPTCENSYGKVYNNFIDFYLNELNLDFIYWDESSGPGILNESYLTYNTWDGHSAKINPITKEIDKKCAVLSIISNEYIMSIAQRMKDKGSFILFNGASTTRERLGLPAFIESQDLILRLYESHLNTPLAYGFRNPSVLDLRRRLDYGTIYARVGFEFQSQVVSKCYPFTPEELHAGWVKGKERVITNRSGSFGWEPPFYAKVYRFDKDGALLNPEPQIEYCDKSEGLEIGVPVEGIAIIERVIER